MLAPSAPPAGLPHSHGGAETQHSGARLARLCLCHRHRGQGQCVCSPPCALIRDPSLFAVPVAAPDGNQALSTSVPAAALLPQVGQQDPFLLLEATWLDSAQPVHEIRDSSFQIPPLPCTAGPGQAQLVQEHLGVCLWSNTSTGSDEKSLAIHSWLRMGSHCLCTHSKTWQGGEWPGVPTLQGKGSARPPPHLAGLRAAGKWANEPRGLCTVGLGCPVQSEGATKLGP